MQYYRYLPNIHVVSFNAVNDLVFTLWLFSLRLTENVCRNSYNKVHLPTLDVVEIIAVGLKMTITGGLFLREQPLCIVILCLLFKQNLPPRTVIPRPPRNLVFESIVGMKC